MQDGLKDMLDIKEYKAVYMLFSFIAVLIDRGTGCAEQAPLTTVHTAFSNLLCSFLFNKTVASEDIAHRWEIKIT